MPSGYGFLDSKPEFWIQMNFSSFQAQSAIRPGVMTVVGRLAPGISIEQAQQRMDGFAAEREKLLPQANRGRGFRLQPLDSAYFGDVRRPLLVLQAAVAVVLLIACANVAGLLLIRATARQREVAIRSALGGGRRRLVRQFLTESLLLSLAGGAGGIVLAWAIVRVLASTGPTWLARVSHISIDGQVLAFSAIVSIVTGLAFGTVPALQLSRFTPGNSLADSGRGATGGRQRRRVQRTLVAAQLALTLVLLVGAGLVVRSFLKLQSAEIGFEPKGLLSFQSRLPANQFFKQVGMIDGSPRLEMSPVPPLLFDRLFQRLQQVPGVRSAAGINFPPLSGVTMPVTFSIEGQPEAAREGSNSNTPSAAYFLVTPNLFKTMRTSIVRGRDITGTDMYASPWVAVVNETLARRYWPAGNALGQRITLSIVPEEQPREIVGIVGDTPIGRMDHGASPVIYASQLQQPLHYRVPYGQSRVMMSYVVRLTQPVDTVLPLVRQAAAEVDSRLPVADIQMVEAYLGRQIEAPRSYMLLLGTFGAVATLLAALGIYGVVAYSVAQRSNELAVRMALGASAGAIVRLVSAEAAWLTAIGSVVGVGAALALTRWLGAVLWEVTATDPASFAAALLLLSTVTMCATLIPASRVLRLDPRSVLVHE
jgi:putative ABC transport system permease protein